MFTLSDDLTVVELIAHFWKHAQTYYRRLDGTSTSEIDNYRQVLRPLKDLYGQLQPTIPAPSHSRWSSNGWKHSVPVQRYR